ncbi:MAG: DUF1893 domain-containing protein [Clostridia bacterium]|nr:DUF1893 domain-containing protein [Clostridia bacterium]
MKNDLEKAKELLTKGGYTCVLCKGETVYTATERGVKPLVDWILKNQEVSGFSAADKVVGKAAALLYVRMEVAAVYAKVMSRAAAETLQRYDIAATYDVMAEAVRNRAGTGLCPMEQTVMNIEEPNAALDAIRAKMKQMSEQLK